ncbi:MAG: SPOR domain-containing protein [Nevskia sp.]|nr:SPOR domain-containing protein [Nevskia sp.]
MQVGSFSDAGRAQTILGLLSNVGHKGEVSTVVTAQGQTLYRVRLGRYDNEAAARQALATVSHQGYPAARAVHEGK